MISLRCASNPSPPCEWRRSRGGVSFSSHRISGFDCLSHCPTHSPVSPLSGNIDSLPGQVALAQPDLRDGVRALHIRHVRANPVVNSRRLSLPYLTVLARATRASRRPLWSPTLVLLQTVSTIPDAFPRDMNTCGRVTIHPTGDFVVTSNRSVCCLPALCLSLFL